MLVVLLTFFSLINGQESIYKHYGVDEGLPSSEVYDVYQDKVGHIWFATDKGLSRFNGYEFKNFDSNDGLPGNVVLRFYPQTNGQVWCYTYHNQALFYFNEQFDGFTAYTYNSTLQKEFNSSSIIKSCFVDASKTLHIGGNNINGELQIDKDGNLTKNYTSDQYFNLEVIPERYVVLNEYAKGPVSYFTTSNKDIISNHFNKRKGASTHLYASWLVPGQKSIFMDGDTIEIINQKKQKKTINSKRKALGMKVIDSTQFFVGYLFGGCKILNNQGQVVNKFLKGKSVTNFLIDHEGGYWFTTSNAGVYYVKNPLVSIHQFQNEDTSSHINSLTRKNSDLIVGFRNGSVATIASDRTVTYAKSNDVNARSAAYVEYDSILKTIYSIRNNTTEYNHELVYNLYLTKLSEPVSNQSIYASNPSGIFDLRKNEFTRLSKRVQDICIYKNDTLIGTPFGVFKKQKDSLASLPQTSELLSYRVEDMDLSKNGELVYIATQGKGIVVYGPEIYNISIQEGLTSDIINEIFVENDTTIWACTNKGLNRIVFNAYGFNITSIDKNAGLLSNEVEDIEIINDTLWVGTKEGLCYLPKRALAHKAINTGFLRLEKVTVNDNNYVAKDTPKLSYDENNITFLVQGISYANHNDLTYQYRLKEVDESWNTSNSRVISFPSLSYGKYTFQVKACIGKTCYTDEQLEYTFIIKPPFWKSGWFYTLCFIAFVGLVCVFFKIRVLSYNKDITREFIRLLIKKLKGDEKFMEIRMNGEDIKIPTNTILFIKSSGNYLDIFTLTKSYTIRCKIGEFIKTTPDALEYLRIHRSYIIRIDKVTGKSKNSVTIKEQSIPVGETYLDQLDKIHF
ncbi:LytTR family transcriptional regulator DNA-binding domain-containing protein [Winogradskyella eckloniae]|uniref:two-component regulator propeller domain-containing protein n=1 Tax=Winogradskyella eckloniae TaxID=1089306 RepID=UPI001566D366|nr:two-component regulator propeller domain-containing protein [Winogradskyella eckloniae]NRD20038.1 LytTR family transcriptional regulator DNA-binding domain-containing protein [Winogradskyella eckloniae]